MGRKKPKTSLEFVLKDPPKSVVTPFLVADLALLLMFVCHVPLMVMGELPPNDILPAVLGLLGSMLAGGLILVWITRVNKRDFRSLGLRVSSWPGFMRGVTFGFLMVLFTFGSIMLIEGFDFNFNASYNIFAALFLLVATLIESAAEEILFRGSLQTGVAAKSSFPVALVLQAVLFTATYGLTPNISIAAAISVFLMGILYGLVFWLTDNLLMTIAMHFIWNFVTGPILGISVTTTLLPTTLLTAYPAASEFISGGAYGIEASVVTIFVCLAACAIVGWKCYKAQGEKN